MKFFACVGLALLVATAGSRAQNGSLESEVNDFVRKAFQSGDGIGSSYHWERELEIKNDPRDWESVLAKLIEPQTSNYGISGTALEVVKLRGTGKNPEIVAALQALIQGWSSDLHERDRPDDFWVQSSPFVSFVSSVLEIGEPTIVQSVLDYTVSQKEQTAPLFNKFTRRDLAEALFQHGSRQHLDGLRKFVDSLNGEEDKQTREMALDAIERIESQPIESPVNREQTKVAEEAKSLDAGQLESPQSDDWLSRIAIIALVCAVLVLVIFGIKKMGGGKGSTAG